MKTFIRWFDEMFREGFIGFVAVMSFFVTALAASCHLTEKHSVRLDARRFSSPVDLQSGQIHMITISLSELSLSQHNTHSCLQKDKDSENRDSLNVRRENVLKEQLC